MSAPARLTVDLAAIEHNLRAAKQLSADAKVLVAVKANAYGHGLTTVARHVEATGVADWLGVALSAEGEQLRAAGVELPILKFSPTLPEDIPAALAADVTLSVGSAAAIAATQEAAVAAGKRVDVHLKVDTGMRRVGTEPADVAALARQLVDASHLSLTGIFTHLPVSDTPDGQRYTTDQLARFHDSVACAQQIAGPIALVHAANSAAIVNHELGPATMVRPGIMAYGSYPDPRTARRVTLRDVARWTTRVLFVKRIAAGEAVGYGHTWTAHQDTWLATIAIGYGDGYSRLLSSRGRVLIGGRSYPIAGRICMDQTMIDLGPEPPTVSVGDEVVLLGSDGEERIGVAELAQLMGTIPYEVTCLITSRVPRHYVGGRG